MKNDSFGPIPRWFKVWAGICAAVGLSFLGLAFWAVITLVNKAH